MGVAGNTAYREPWNKARSLAFVNEHRLREVEQRLADPQCDRLPILTLALEAGFGSIGTFNRAFRERHDVTLSAYPGARGDGCSGLEPI